MDIYQDFEKDVDEIVKRYKNKVSRIINGLMSEDDQNKLLDQLEKVHPGMNFKNAKEILHRWESEINEKIRPTLFYN
jgi:glutamate synthase domain-containing protein 3